MKFRIITLSCAAALAAGVPALAKHHATGASYAFNAQNASGETGNVTLTAAGADATNVTIALKNAGAGPQPAHIHPGSCAKLDPKPEFPLSNVVDGKSVTVVKAPLATLENGSYAVNIHKSTNDVATYVSCANLFASAPAMKGDAMKGDAPKGASMKPVPSAAPSP